MMIKRIDYLVRSIVLWFRQTRNATKFSPRAINSDEINERWEGWARERATEVSDAKCKQRFQLLESLARMPVAQREASLPAAAAFDSWPDDPDEEGFGKMLRGWMHRDSTEFGKRTLERLQCDAEAWKRWSTP